MRTEGSSPDDRRRVAWDCASLLSTHRPLLTRSTRRSNRPDREDHHHQTLGSFRQDLPNSKHRALSCGRSANRNGRTSVRTSTPPAMGLEKYQRDETGDDSADI